MFYTTSRNWSGFLYINSVGNLSLREQYTFRIFSNEYILKNILKVFDSYPKALQELSQAHKIKNWLSPVFNFVRLVGIEPTTISLKGSCSTD
jgi:hypothetical protein